MKILFLTTEAPDFLQDLVFDGLVRLLGVERVYDYPPLERFHSPAPADKRDQAMHYLNLPRGPHMGVELEQLVDDVDAVVGPIRGTARTNLMRVLALRAGKPIAVLDGWDDPYVRAGITRVDVYFKRETLTRAWWLRCRLPVRKLYHALHRRPDWLDPLRRQITVATPQVEKLVPLPLAVIDNGFVPAREKRFDIAFLGAPTSRERVALVKGLRRLKADGYRVFFPDDPEWQGTLWLERTRLPWHEYMQLLSSSRICISLRGLGYDTYRYWEIPYTGSLLLSEPARTVIPDNFVDRVEAVFAPPSQLIETARQLLERDTQQIAAAGRTKLLRSHTSVQRAEVVAGRLEALRR